tara:strand:- start:616 stop:1185 length:570 start_codon:yes stop_codon:yes gene_type:complete
MKIFIFSLIFIFNFQYIVNSKTSSFKSNISKPPLCTNNKGEKVSFKNLNSRAGRFITGIAKRDLNGLPIIYRFNYHKSSKALQMFIDFHECAHHQTGDLEKRPPPQNSFKYKMKENTADCVAAIRIKSDIINGKSIIKEALFELKKDMKIIGFSKSVIESRELNIKNCFKKDISLNEYLNYILVKRGLK